MSTEIVTRSTQSHTITVEAANELIKIARAASQQIGFEVAIAVTDTAGNLKAFERTDACPFLAADVAIDKAWTAAAFGLSTHTWASILTNPLVSQLAHRPRLVAVGGGYPVIESGRVIGAIGVSGGTAEQDQQAAEAALSSLDFTLPA
ncbi:heme-binding protein (plasmid) [Tunturibacter empetritectus]|uniref:Heme-binding protein n=1 Tax=Tunturiibacter empetritectus TaxID=3069691 RepID=A0AAU7ZIM4_9BACT